MRKAILVAAALAAFALPARAQTDADIVVVGEPVAQLAQEFVGEISAPSLQEDQLARWDEHICVGATGFAVADAQRVIDRISARAATLGLRLGEPGCRANIMVIYAQDSDAVAREIVDNRARVLGYYTSYTRSTAGREALETFANTPRPVRWWHVVRNTAADGETLVETNARPGPRSSPGYLDVQDTQVIRSSGTRLQRPTRQDLEYLLVIVDARRVEGIPASAWIDYVAMVSLAQISADALPNGVPSILNLFAGGSDAVPAALTDWDEAYLQGLYRAARAAPNTQAQQRQISRRMTESLTETRPD